MTPSKIAFGEERHRQIEQNEDHAQPDIHTKAPLTVVFVSANLTPTDSKLEIHGPKNFTSGPLVANGNGSYQAALPTGSYTVSAADIPGSKPPSSWSARTAPRPRTTSCCPERRVGGSADRRWIPCDRDA